MGEEGKDMGREKDKEINSLFLPTCHLSQPAVAAVWRIVGDWEGDKFIVGGAGQEMAPVAGICNVN